MQEFDIIIIGAGASGLFAAARAIQANKTVCILDMGKFPARKVMVSGGGKCNFTNARADYTHYFGANPKFVRGALARWTPTDTLNWIKSHNIDFYEKSPGQYFAESADKIVAALLHDATGAKIVQNKTVQSVQNSGDKFMVQCHDNTQFTAKKLIVATGGISYSNLGTSDTGYKIAKQFGHKIIPPCPALCAIKTNIFTPELSGISMPVEIKIGRDTINDDMLFTHFGLGGPAIYRATARNTGNGFTINLLPEINAFDWLREHKQTNGKKQLKTILAQKMPERVAEFIANTDTKNIADYRDSELHDTADKINNIKIDKIITTGFNTAEVTHGGVDTNDISSKTMESKLCKNLYFIGEVLDVTGDLGGYNLQWAWSSASVVDIS